MEPLCIRSSLAMAALLTTYELLLRLKEVVVLDSVLFNQMLAQIHRKLPD